MIDHIQCFFLSRNDDVGVASRGSLGFEVALFACHFLGPLFLCPMIDVLAFLSCLTFLFIYVNEVGSCCR